MSFTPADAPMCDGPCGRTYPPGWEAAFIAVWPVVDSLMSPSGQMTAAQADAFHLCGDCLRSIVLKADLPDASRVTAIRNADRWARSQRLLAELKAIDRATFAAEAA